MVAGRDPTGTAPPIGPGTRQLDVTVYHQAQGPLRPASLKVWTSTDGGRTWQPARLRDGDEGSHTATYTLPDIQQTNGSLSIKAQATDAGGNDVTQILTDAVRLTAATPTHH